VGRLGRVGSGRWVSLNHIPSSSVILCHLLASSDIWCNLLRYSVILCHPMQSGRLTCWHLEAKCVWGEDRWGGERVSRRKKEVCHIPSSRVISCACCASTGICRLWVGQGSGLVRKRPNLRHDWRLQSVDVERTRCCRISERLDLHSSAAVVCVRDHCSRM